MARIRWSGPAGLRGVRAAVVIPALFAIGSKAIGDQQVATFAAFGGFATLVLASFGGTRADRARAHLGLGLAGSALLTIGTVVSSSTATAAVVTAVVAFAVLWTGIAGPNAATGANAAMLAYVLLAASPGTVGMIPDRLAGWWLASLVGGLAVVLTSPARPANRLRSAVAASALSLADELDAATTGGPLRDRRDRAVAAKHELLAAFTAAPYRPTGLAGPDQALGNVVETLEWCTNLVGDATADGLGGADWAAPDVAVIRAASGVLRTVEPLVLGRPSPDPWPDVQELERLRVSARHDAQARRQEVADPEIVHRSWHSGSIAVSVRSLALDALIAGRRADPHVVAAQRRAWLGDDRPLTSAGPAAPGAGPTVVDPSRPGDRWPAASGMMAVARRHASIRSVWTLNSVRGAIAIAAAVAVADLTNVQHGFWVVLGTLSVLRTNAGATGATALRALAGNLVGFVVGAALVLGLGTDATALWLCLPVAVLVAAYAPGALPFAAGQAAFTVLVSILYNLIVPVGWKVGVLRVEDVALGCGVSLAVGVLLWPRGASAVVGDDLHDAFVEGADYLDQAVDWALGARPVRPDAGRRTADAAVRLDDAVRGYLAEQGSKRVAKEDLWRLIGAALRLRLTAHSLAGLNPPSPAGRAGGPATEAVTGLTDDIAGWYRALATHLRQGEPSTIGAVDAAIRAGSSARTDPGRVGSGLLYCLLTVEEHLRHLVAHQAEVVGPAGRVSAMRARGWWH